MITTRERIRLSELVRGWRAAGSPPIEALLEDVVPLTGRHLLYASQGKAAFEQIVVSAGLAGSRVIVPAFFPDDFVGVFQKYRMTPVFADVDPDTYHLDLQAIGAAHLHGARALIVEHTFGLPADGARYRAFCDAHGLVCIEDCARALGAAHRGRLVGGDGQHAMFSLPKCAPVRAGGLALSESPLQAPPLPARLGVAGLLHAATLIKYPGVDAIEGVAYSLLADSPIYPLEVGNYEPQPVRGLDAVARFMLNAFLPLYRSAIDAKRECAHVLRAALEPMGFRFQSDGAGEHICTSLSAEPPPGQDADRLKAYLVAHGVKASAMWRNAWGVADFGVASWGARPDTTPVALCLSRRLVQLPVSRFRTPAESARIIDLCTRFVAGRASTTRNASLASERV